MIIGNTLDLWTDDPWQQDDTKPDSVVFRAFVYGAILVFLMGFWSVVIYAITVI